MKRKYKEIIFFGKYECNLKKKICFEVYWSNRTKIKFENIIQLPEIRVPEIRVPEIVEIDLCPQYVCIIHNNDKCMCSIYDCRGTKKKHGGNNNNISQFI